MWNSNVEHNHLAVKWSPREIIKRPDDPWCIYCRWATHLQQWNTIYRRVNWWVFTWKTHHFFIVHRWRRMGKLCVMVMVFQWFCATQQLFMTMTIIFPCKSSIFYLFMGHGHGFHSYVNNHKASQLNLSHVAWRLCDTPYKVMPHGPSLIGN